MTAWSSCSWQHRDATGDLSPKVACFISGQLSKNQVSIIDLTTYTNGFSHALKVFLGLFVVSIPSDMVLCNK